MRAKVLVLLAVAISAGCGARVEVVKDKIKAQVDALLGEVNVKRKEVDIAMRTLKSDVDKVKKQKIEARVRVEQLDSQVKGIDDKLASSDKTLERISGLLKSDKDVEISGKVVTKDQLKAMAQQALTARKRLTDEKTSLETANQRMKKIFATLEKRETDGQGKLKSMAQTIEEIDLKASTLQTMQQTAHLSGEGGGMDFAAVEKSVKELGTKVETEIAYQDEKWDEQNSKDDLASIDALLKETASGQETANEIDKVLGKK